MCGKETIKELEHTLKMWEKRYGYIGHGRKWLDFFSDVKDKPFTLYVEDERLFEKKIDKMGRIYIGRMPLDRFKVGETLICFRDSEGNYHIKKKK